MRERDGGMLAGRTVANRSCWRNTHCYEAQEAAPSARLDGESSPRPTAVDNGRPSGRLPSDIVWTDPFAVTRGESDESAVRSGQGTAHRHRPGHRHWPASGCAMRRAKWSTFFSAARRRCEVSPFRRSACRPNRNSDNFTVVDFTRAR